MKTKKVINTRYARRVDPPAVPNPYQVERRHYGGRRAATAPEQPAAAPVAKTQPKKKAPKRKSATVDVAEDESEQEDEEMNALFDEQFGARDRLGRRLCDMPENLIVPMPGGGAQHPEEGGAAEGIYPQEQGGDADARAEAPMAAAAAVPAAA